MHVISTDDWRNILVEVFTRCRLVWGSRSCQASGKYLQGNFFSPSTWHTTTTMSVLQIALPSALTAVGTSCFLFQYDNYFCWNETTTSANWHRSIPKLKLLRTKEKPTHRRCPTAFGFGIGEVRWCGETMGINDITEMYWCGAYGNKTSIREVKMGWERI